VDRLATFPPNKGDGFFCQARRLHNPLAIPSVITRAEGGFNGLAFGKAEQMSG
jgi:hypothetical protein